MSAFGQPVTLTYRVYSDPAETVLADATTVAVDVLDPAGTETTYTLAATQVVRTSLGVYTLTLTPTTGHYAAHWYTTGPTTAGDTAFDVTAKYDPQLVSLADAKAHLNITRTTDDDELQSVIDAATALLSNHPGFNIPVGLTTYTEWHDGGTGLLILQHYPIVDVTSVTEYSGTTAQPIADEPEDGGAFTGYGFRYNAENGMLYRTSSGYPTGFAGRVKVVYVAGMGAVPADVRQAALLLVEHMWDTQRGGASVGLPLDDDLTAPDSTQFGVGFTLPNRVRELLEPYRKAPAVA